MTEIPKAYEPQSVEDKWYQFWLEQNCFTANPHSRKPAYSSSFLRPMSRVC